MKKEANLVHRKYSRRVFLFLTLILLATASSLTNADLDSYPVIIENISEYVLDSSVIIYWDTNILADSLIKYGTDQNLNESNYLGVHSYSHAAEISGLYPNTLYYYVVNSTNANGNSNQSEINNFTTSEDNISPVYSNINITYGDEYLYRNLSDYANVVYSKNRNYSFRITIKDNGIISSVKIFHNFLSYNESDINSNYSVNITENNSNATNTSESDIVDSFIWDEMINIPGTDIYEYKINEISVGNHIWKIVAEDISGNKMETGNYIIDVNKSTPSLITSINNIYVSEGQNINVEEKSTVNISAVLAEGDAGAIIEITISNSTAVINSSSGNDQSNLSQYFNLPELYNIIVNYKESSNYAETNFSYYVNITPIEINLFIDKPEYNLGEQVSYVVLAPNSSNLSIEVCGPLPTGSGFVECRNLLLSQQNDYPYMGIQSVTNKSGVYKIRAQMQYKGLNKYAEKNYSVVNNIAIAISGDTLVKIGKESNILATATGGVGVLLYNWTLPNGTKISGPNFNVVYNSAGSYSIVLTVTDQAGNSKTSTITLIAKKHYTIKVYVVDDSDNTEIDSARVKMTATVGEESDSDNTNVEGMAELDLIEGDYDLKVSSSGYSSFLGTAKSDSDKTITVRLSRATSSSSNEPLEISLIAPLNKTLMPSSSVYFDAYVEIGGNTQTNCIFYVADANNEWYRAMKTVLVKSSGRINHTESFSDGKTYSWKVQCDTGSKTYSSDVFRFTASGIKSDSDASLTILEDGYNHIIDAGEIRTKIDDAMTNLEAMDMESRKDAEALQFSSSVEKALRDYERAMRDINNIQYRRDLSQTEQDAKKLEYYDIIRDLEKETMLNIKNLGYQTFISYPSKEDLINISRIYQQETNIIGRVNEDELSSKQNGLIVTTRISNVEITYVNGEKKTITLVDKTIKLSDNSTGAFLLESIPKEIAESSKELTVLSDFKVINEDPLLKFEKQDKITYYVDGEKNIELGKKANTVLLADNFFGTRNSITGDVTLSNIDISSPTSLIIIIAIISCSYLIYAFDLFGLIFSRSRKKADERNINKIFNLIRDARILLQNGRVNDADLAFKEIKLVYEGSSENVMNEVYSEASGLLEIIDTAQTEMLIRAALNNTGQDMTNEEKEKLLNSRRMLKAAYELLSDDLKAKYGPKINSIVQDQKEDEKNKMNA